MKRIINIFDQAYLHSAWTAFWVVIIVHLTMLPQLFFTFTALHGSYVRNYWAILEGSSGEYGAWPGMLKAMGHDLLWIFMALTVIIVPLNLAKKYVNSKLNFFEAVSEYLLRSLLALALTFVGGAIFVSLFAVLLMSIGLFILGSPVSEKFDEVIEIFASGIIITDLFFCAITLYLNSRFYRDPVNVGGGLVSSILSRPVLNSFAVAVVISMTASFIIKTEVKLDLPQSSDKIHVYSYDAFGGKIKTDNSGLPDLYKIDRHYVNQTVFTDGGLYTNLSDDWRYVFISSPSMPFNGYFKGFFQSRPDSVNFNFSDMKAVVSYSLKPYFDSKGYIYSFTGAPVYSRAAVNLRKGPDENFVSSSVLTRVKNNYYTVAVTPQAETLNSRWGIIIVQEKTGSRFFFAVRKNLLEHGVVINNDLHVKHSADSEDLISELLVRDEESGITLFVNSVPLIYSELEFSEIIYFTEERGAPLRPEINTGTAEKNY